MSLPGLTSACTPALLTRRLAARSRSCREESRGRFGDDGCFDSANLYIEGDNLEVLKILRETCLGKVKMIYIDPPYNTGNDFICRDRFVQDEDEYLERSGQLGGEGARLFPNTESNGRFHTDWLNMICPRMKVARSLLADDGVIFISIDDNEAANLAQGLRGVFGEGNFLAQCVRKRRDSQANLSRNISPVHEYILVHAKRNGELLNRIAANMDEAAYKNPDNDPRGPYIAMPCTNKGGAVYAVTTPAGAEITEEWRLKEETFDSLLADNRIIFPRGGGGKPRYKLFLADKRKEGQLANTWLDSFGSNQDATREIKALFDNKLFFDAPKPVALLVFCLQLATGPDSLILDFFSGSATTAHAVMQLNVDDGGARRFIMVQLPETCAEDSEAFKAGFRNICEIGKERIRRAGDHILRGSLDALEKEGIVEKSDSTESAAQDIEEITGGIITQKQLARLKALGYRICPDVLANAQSPEAASRLSVLSSKLSMDTGFRVLKVDSSNMLDVCVTAPEFTADSICEENIKPDRTPDDLLIQAMLDVGIELSSFIDEKMIEGRRVFFADGDALAACFDEAIPDEAILQIARRKPRCFYMRDSGYASDCDADNFEQIFRTCSPETRRRIL